MLPKGRRTSNRDKPGGDTVRFYRMRLPHWEVERGVYFVTIREKGSLPKDVVAQLRSLIGQSQGKEGDEWLAVQRRIFVALEAGLDRPDSGGVMARPEVAGVLCEAIGNRQERGVWDMMEYVIMPNHIHLLFLLNSGTLKSVLEDFKRWTARRIRMSCQDVTDGGGVSREAFSWQREWFDHWSRGPEEDVRIAEYVRQNPVKAGFVNDFRAWAWGSWNGVGEKE